MTNTISKIGIYEAIAFIVIFMLNNIILNVPKEIINTVSSSAWINIIFLTIICLIFIILVCKLFKNFPYMDIVDISEFLGGRILKIVIGSAFIIIFVLLVSSSLRIFSTILQINILYYSPITFICAFFLIGFIFANRFGVKTISKVAAIAFSVVAIGFVVLVFTLNEHYVYESLFPILGYGPKETFLNGLTNIYAFAGISLLYFIKPYLADEKNFNSIAILSVIISGILLLLSILNQILMFGVIFNSEILMGMVLSSRILGFGDFFQRVDAIFTFLWIFSQLCYGSILTFFTLTIFRKLTNNTDQNGMLYSLITIIFAICVIPKNFTELSTSLITFLNPAKTILIFIICPVILILANLKFKSGSPPRMGGKND